MTLLDLIENELITNYLDGKTSYKDTLNAMLLSIPKDDNILYRKEKLEIFLKKIKKDSIAKVIVENVYKKGHIYPLQCLQIETVAYLINDSLKELFNGKTSNVIFDRLVTYYGISQVIASFIVDEAITYIKFNTLSSDEMGFIGEMYINEKNKAYKSQKAENIEKIKLVTN